MLTSLSQWLASRPRSRTCTTVVLHATAGAGVWGAVSTLRLKGLSYHYLIEKSGAVVKCCPSGRVAFHAGVSRGPEGNGVNAYSLGLSFVNLNDGKDPLTAAQMTAARGLIEELRVAFPSLRWVTTHWAISPGRKTDPRRLSSAELKAFAEACGLEAWVG